VFSKFKEFIHVMDHVGAVNRLEYNRTKRKHKIVGTFKIPGLEELGFFESNLSYRRV